MLEYYEVGSPSTQISAGLADIVLQVELQNLLFYFGLDNVYVWLLH
jgi:hypothetical protein